MKFSKSRQRRGGQPFDDEDVDFDDEDVNFGFKMGKYPSNLDMISDTAESLSLPSDFSSKYPKTNRYPPDSRYFPSPTAELEKSDPLPEDKIPGYNNPGSRVRSRSRARSRSRSRSRALSRTRSRSGGNRRKRRRKTKTKRIRRNSRR